LAALDELLAAQTDPQRRAEIMNKRGVALVELNRRDEARSVFELVLAIDPQYAPAIVNLGNLELEAGEIDTAIALYQRALEADSGSASACRHLAIAYRRAGRTADALNAFARARRLEGRRRPKQRT
jgi:tetratricopeptide (TPR) repeat protein